MKIALMTVIYPKSSKFLKEYAINLSKQKLNNLSLIVVKDKYSQDLDIFKKNLNGITCDFIHSNSSPLINRINGLKHCYKKKFDLVICSDIDDLFCPNAITSIKNFFIKNTQEKIAYSNLIYKNKKKIVYFNKRKKNIFLKDIINYNFLGYGSLAMRRKIIPFFIKTVKEKAIIIDWYFALKYLLFYKRIKVIQGSKIFYRSHTENFLGPVRKVNAETIFNAIKYKMNTYSKLIVACNKFNIKKVFLFEKKLEEQKKLKQNLKIKKNLKNYIKAIKIDFLKKKCTYWFQEAYYNKILLN